MANKEFDNVQLFAEYDSTVGSSVVNVFGNKSKENIAYSLSKIKNWFPWLVPTNGSAGQILEWYNNIPTWRANTNADTVKQTHSTDTDFHPLVLGAPHSESAWSGSDPISETTDQVYMNKGVYVKPSTSTIYATEFVGKVTHPTIPGTGDDTTSSVTPLHGQGFTTVDVVTRDSNGHVTGINTKTVTLPAQYVHPTYTRTDTTSTASPAHGGTFTAIDSVSSTNGHVTAVNLKTVTLPAQYVHPSKTQTDTTSSVSPAHEGSFTVIDSITRDTQGHVSGINVKTVTLPSDKDTNWYHKTGTWNGLTYTAAKVGSPEDLAFTIPTGTTSTTVALGNHTHAYTVPVGIVVKTGSSDQSHITLQTLMTWLITTKGYITSNTARSLTLYTSWSYAGNDILQLTIDGTAYELQLAGVIIEFDGYASDYQTGTFRLRIHSSPTVSFTPASGYTQFPASHIAEYTCNGSSYSPTWKMIATTADLSGYLPLSGGTMTGDITFTGLGNTPSSYPAKSKGIYWSGGTDSIDMYYNVRSADAGELIINMRDDANVRTSFAYNGTVKSYIDTDGTYNGKATTSSRSYALYTDAIGTSSSTHAGALQTYFEANKSTIVRNQGLGYYSSSYSNGSFYFGYFLNGYDSNPYGGFFVCNYNTPYYVGIQNGTYVEHKLLTNQNYTSHITQLGTVSKGSVTKGIYLDVGVPKEMTYELKATVNGGTANCIAYYSGANAISSAAKVTYVNANNSASTPATVAGLHIESPTYGNTAANMIGGVAGVFSYGDGGPQIRFKDASSTQAGALIFTADDAAATGTSWHFVSNETDWNVISKRFHAKTSISIGTDKPSTSYNLTVNGTSYFNNTITIKGTSSGNANIYYASYGNARNSTSIKFYDGDVNGHGIQIGGGGLTVVGGGESAQTVFNGLSTLGLDASSEHTIISADSTIYMMTCLDQGVSNRQTFTFNTAGDFDAPRYSNAYYFKMKYTTTEDSSFDSNSVMIYSNSDGYFRRGSLSKLGSLLGPLVTNVGDGNVIHDSAFSSPGWTRPIHRAKVNTLRSNKLAFTKAANITVEYTSDGGSNWSTLTDEATKENVFIMRHIGGVTVGPNNGATRTTSMQTRITITNDGNRDCMIDQFYIWATYTGHTTVCDIQYSTQSAKTTFVNWKMSVPVNGWSGPSIINVSEVRYGGTIYAIRLTFRITAVREEYKNSTGIIYDIQAFGGMADWAGTIANYMEKYDHLYSWDRNQVATFPAEIKIPSQLRVYNGNYGTLLRSDGTNTYLLVTDSGSAVDGSWNSLRPFYFNNSTGYVQMGNGASIYGGLLVGTNATDKLTLKGATTSGSSAYNSNNPRIRFSNANDSQNIELIFNDNDNVLAPASIALRGDQGGEWLSVPRLEINGYNASFAPEISVKDPNNKGFNLYYGNSHASGWSVLQVRPGDAAGVGVTLGCSSGGATIVGSGESGYALNQTLWTAGLNPYVNTDPPSAWTPAEEKLFLSSDNEVYIMSGMQNYGTTRHTDWSDIKTAIFDTAGSFRPSINNKGSIGDATHQWTNIYGGTIYENGTSLANKYEAKGAIQNYLPIYGYRNGAGFTYYQGSDDFGGTEGARNNPDNHYAHYLIANHGNGQTYYHYTLRLPFWSTPQYQRKTGGSTETDSRTRWFNFLTEETGAAKPNYCAFPADGFYSASTSTVTGAMVITLPIGFSAIMLQFTVEIFNYITNKSCMYRISGYVYDVDSKWYNVTATCISGYGYDSNAHRAHNLKVRFGRNSTSGKAQIQIGEISTIWDWPGVQIRDVLMTHSTVQFDTISQGWSISFQSSANIDNISNTVDSDQVATYANVLKPYAGNEINFCDLGQYSNIWFGYRMLDPSGVRPTYSSAPITSYNFGNGNVDGNTSNLADIYAKTIYARGGSVYAGYQGGGDNVLPSYGYHVYDLRNATVTPAMADHCVQFYFSNAGTPDNRWWSVIHVRGWNGSYNTWQLAGPAHNSDQRTTPLYVRSSNTSSTWGSWRKIYDSSNVPTASELGFGTIVTHAEGDYLPSTTKYAGSNTVGGVANNSYYLGDSTAPSTYKLRYINSTDVTTWTSATLATTDSIAVIRGTVTDAWTTGHIVTFNVASVGTPFQIGVHDSSELYFYKRYKTGTNTWSGWTKMNAGNADIAAQISTQAGTANAARVVFFADNTSNQKVVYDTAFTYNPSGGILKLKTINLAATTGISYTGTKAEKTMISFKDNTSDGTGNGIVIGGGGLTIIGGGESASTVAAQYSSGGNEDMYVANDGNVYIVSNLDGDNGWANRKTFTFNTSGDFTGSRYIYASYLNQSSGVENGSFTTSCNFMYNLSTDGFLRKVSASTVGSVMSPILTPYEAKLVWGGTSKAGSFGPVDAGICSRLGANRLELAKPAGIKIYRATNGISNPTWSEVSATDAQKLGLFSMIGNQFNISASSTAGTGTAAANNIMMVQINSTNASVYTQLEKFIINVTTGGAAGCFVKIKIQSKANDGTNVWSIWDEVKQNWIAYNDSAYVEANTHVPLTGDSGWNVINVKGFITYSWQTQHFLTIQLIFGCTANSGTRTGLGIINILGYGGNGWICPSNLARTGHLYDYDVTQNAYFPAAVYGRLAQKTNKDRQSTANLSCGGTGSMQLILATSTMDPTTSNPNTGKPASDGFILDFDWDNTGQYKAQIFVSNSGASVMQWRGQTGSSDWSADNSKWHTLVDSINFKPYKSITQRLFYCAGAGWRRIMTIRSGNNNGYVMNDIKIFVRRHYNNASPESFSFHVINNYDSIKIRLLHAEQYVQLFDGIRVSKSSDSKYQYIEINYTSPNNNAVSVRYDIVSPYTTDDTIEPNNPTYPADGTLAAISDSPTPLASLLIPTGISQFNLRQVNGWQGGYFGMADATGGDSAWIRTTSQGLIPYTEGVATTGGNCYLGTSSWYFKEGYISKVYANTIDCEGLAPRHTNEINFKSPGSTLWFAYRIITDDKGSGTTSPSTPINTYLFGCGKANTEFASLKCKTVMLAPGTNAASYAQLTGGTLTASRTINAPDSSGTMSVSSVALTSTGTTSGYVDVPTGSRYLVVEVLIAATSVKSFHKVAIDTSCTSTSLIQTTTKGQYGLQLTIQPVQFVLSGATAITGGTRYLLTMNSGSVMSISAGTIPSAASASPQIVKVYAQA